MKPHFPLAVIAAILAISSARSQPVAVHYFRTSFANSSGTDPISAFGATLLPTGTPAGADLSISGRNSSTGVLTMNGYAALTGNFLWNQPGAVISAGPAWEEFVARGPGGRIAVFGNNAVGMGIGSAVIEVRNGAGPLLYSIVDSLVPGYSTIPAKAVFDGSGNLYVGGLTSGSGGLRSFLAKYSPTGARLWFREPGLARTGSTVGCNGISILPDGSLWGAFNYANRAHVWQVDPGGTTLFGSTYQIESLPTETAAAGISNGRFFVVGYVYSGGSRDIFVRQYVKNSAWITSRYTIPGSGPMTVAGTAADVPGSIYALMRLSGIQSSLIKINRAGEVVWSRITGLTEPRDLQIDDFGNVYSLGQKNSSTATSRIMKHNSVGTLDWDFSAMEPGYRGRQLLVDRPNGALFVLHQPPAGAQHAWTRLRQAPIAEGNSAVARKNVPTPVNLLANDAYAAGCTIEVVSGPSRGTVTVDASGVATYTSRGAYLGLDSFTYRLVRSGDVFSSGASVNITVVP